MRDHPKSRLLAAVVAVLLAFPGRPARGEDAAPSSPAPTPAPPARIDLPPVVAPPTGQRLPGKVIWFDLLTQDPARARPFYEGVLGWTFEDRGGYAVARDGAVPVAGLLQMPAPKAGAPAPQSRWMPLVSVADVSRAAAAAQKAGGRILEGPGSLGARGRYAAVADPRGAQLVLVTATGGDPVDADAPPPGWIWAELWTDDPRGAATFYKAVLGYDTWQVGAGKQATWIYASGGRPRARAARMPFEKVPSQWLPYVVVKDLKGALARVPTLGGRVLRQPGAKGPQFAVVSDPGGAAFIVEQRPDVPAADVAQASPPSSPPAAPAADSGAAAVAAAPAPPPPATPTPPPPDANADPFGIDAAQQRSAQDAVAAAASPTADVLAAPGGEAGVVVAAPSPFVNVWIAPPAWGPYWGGGGWWAYPPGWVGAPWWGAPPVWGPGYRPPYYPGGGYYPGYRPPPGGYYPGGRPGVPGYRPPAPPPPRGGGVAPRPVPGPAYHGGGAPAPRPSAPAPRR